MRRRVWPSAAFRTIRCVKQPGTRCHLRVYGWPAGEEPVPGDLLRTRAGSCYRIEEWRPARAGAKSLGTIVAARLERDAVQFGEPGRAGVGVATTKMKTPEVRAALKARHASDRGWVTLEEYANIDMLAFACHSQYRHGAYELSGVHHPWIGYEIKVSRSDFRAEMRKPHKRAWGVAITNEFYFAVPAGLVTPDEVPADCGLLYVTRGGSRVVSRAPITRALPLPQLHVSQMLRHGIDPGFIRAMQAIKATARWRERQAQAAIDAANAERARLLEVLAARLGGLVTVGSSWRASEHGTRARWWERDLRVVVSAVGDTVRLESPELGWSPRLPLGEFLAEFVPVRNP